MRVVGEVIALEISVFLLVGILWTSISYIIHMNDNPDQKDYEAKLKTLNEVFGTPEDKNKKGKNKIARAESQRSKFDRGKV